MGSKWKKFTMKKNSLNIEKVFFKNNSLKKGSLLSEKIKNLINVSIKKNYSIWNLIKRKEIKFNILKKIGIIRKSTSYKIYKILKIQSTYSGYIKRQKKDLYLLNNYNKITIPIKLNYKKISGLSNE